MKKQEQSTVQILTTKRLILRALEMTDAGEIFKLRSNKEVNRYLDRPATTAIGEAEAFVIKIQSNECFYWAITLNTGNKFIGTICLWNINTKNESTEVGYELHPDFQRMGIMREALSKVIEYGFQQLKLKQMIAFTHAENTASISLLEKTGFKRYQAPESKNEYPVLALVLY